MKDEHQDLEERAEKYNLHFKKYPAIHFDKGWLYGIWYCSRSFQKQTYYGQYPLTYLNRLRILFEDIEPKLHLFSGIVKKEKFELTLDNNPELNPDYCCSAENMEIKDRSIGVIFADPPYSKAHALKYSCGVYPNMKKVFNECGRVLKDNGYLCWLHSHLLSVPRSSNLKLCGTIGVLTGTNAIVRLLSIYRKNIII